MPVADAASVAMWHALGALDERLASPWCLVGGQLVVLHCLEHGVAPVRATDDGDVAVDVFASRGALSAATSILAGLGYEQVTDRAGYGYRWANGAARVDVLVPEQANRQRRPALTRRGARTRYCSLSTELSCPGSHSPAAAIWDGRSSPFPT